MNDAVKALSREMGLLQILQKADKEMKQKQHIARRARKKIRILRWVLQQKVERNRILLQQIQLRDAELAKKNKEVARLEKIFEMLIESCKVLTETNKILVNKILIYGTSNTGRT